MEQYQDDKVVFVVDGVIQALRTLAMSVSPLPSKNNNRGLEEGYQRGKILSHREVTKVKSKYLGWK